MPETEMTSPCIRTDKPEGYIDLYFTEASRRAVDTMLEHVKAIARQSREEPETLPPTVRILVNSTSGKVQPIGYLINRLSHERKNLVFGKPTRFAATFNSPIFINIVRAVVFRLNTDLVRFRPFLVQEFEQALAWLLADD